MSHAVMTEIHLKNKIVKSHKLIRNMEHLYELQSRGDINNNHLLIFCGKHVDKEVE